MIRAPSRPPLKTALPPLMLFALVVAIWHAVTVIFSIQSFLLPSPLVVGATAWEKRVQLASAVGLTAAGASCGFLCSLALGSLVAFLFSQSKLIRLSVYPYAIFLQTVPIVAIAPLIIIWFGNGFHSVVIVAMIISLFPIITNGATGLLAVERPLLELFAVCNATRGQILWKLRLPNAVPYLVAGARVSSGLSVVGAIVGEFFVGYGADAFGLGYLIIVTSNQLKTDYLFAAIIASALLGLAMFALISGVGNAILRRWHCSAGQ